MSISWSVVRVPLIRLDNTASRKTKGLSNWRTFGFRSHSAASRSTDRSAREIAAISLSFQEIFDGSGAGTKALYPSAQLTVRPFETFCRAYSSATSLPSMSGSQIDSGPVRLTGVPAQGMDISNRFNGSGGELLSGACACSMCLLPLPCREYPIVPRFSSRVFGVYL